MDVAKKRKTKNNGETLFSLTQEKIPSGGEGTMCETRLSEIVQKEKKKS